jgi:phosphomannomutase
MSHGEHPQSSAIQFGTDGWRAVIADGFTFANVRIVAAAIANYVLECEEPQRGLCIGYDTRFGSARFARAVAEVVASAGIPVQLADRITPTPALSHAVRARGAAGGVMITSSHNPSQWNGVKYKASYGGSGSPKIMAEIESRLYRPLLASPAPAPIVLADFCQDYVAAIRNFADLNAIARSGHRFLIDSLHGAGAGILAGIFAQAGIASVSIHSEPDPLFGGLHPEPIPPHTRAAQAAVVAERCSAGWITDGDADRIGAVDEHGNFVDSHKIFCILLRWLLERKRWPGDVVRSLNVTRMADRICARHQRTLHQVGIGFKYICDLMLSGNILIGGEESGGIGIARHLPERDGLLNALLLANVMADEQKTLGELVADLQCEFGAHFYDRIDLHLPEAAKQAAMTRLRAGLGEFAGMAVERVETQDGVLLFLKNPAAAAFPNAAQTWLLFRASGTEPLLRLYCESCTPELVQTLLHAARQFALSFGDTH